MGSEMCIRDSCYTAATVRILLTATSQPNVYWLEEVVGPVADRFGELASASRTLSAITDFNAVFQREVDTFFGVHFRWVHAPPPPACLSILLWTAATFSPSMQHHQM